VCVRVLHRSKREKEKEKKKRRVRRRMTCRRCRWIDKRRSRYFVKGLAQTTAMVGYYIHYSTPHWISAFNWIYYVHIHICVLCADGRGAVRIFRGDGPSDTHKKPCPFIIDRPPDTKTKEGLVNKQITNKKQTNKITTC
jgi:hypothetical protein